MLSLVAFMTYNPDVSTEPILECACQEIWVFRIHRPAENKPEDTNNLPSSSCGTMYSDLLDVLGNQNPSATRGSDKHVAVSFKAGKMKMALQEVSGQNPIFSL